MASQRVGSEPGRRAIVAQRMVEAMRRDMEGQRELIDARAKGETDSVYWEPVFSDPEVQELYREHPRLRNQAQCAMILAHLAIEKVKIEVARARALCAASQAKRVAVPSGHVSLQSM